MKKYFYIFAFLAAINSALAKMPEIAFKELLSDEGKILKNSLKIVPIIEGPYCESRAKFKGEITLSGVLERIVYNAGGLRVSSELFFYPDDKKFLPFYHEAQASDIVTSGDPHCDLDCNYKCDYSKVKDFSPLPIPVMLKVDKKVLETLPKPLNENFPYRVGIRAVVTLKDYEYTSGSSYDSADSAHATLTSFKALSDINLKKEEEQTVGFPVLYYNTNDDYINIRQSPNGKIIGKIYKESMKKGAVIISADTRSAFKCQDMEEWLKDNKITWLEIWYVPDEMKTPLDVVHGYIHHSQFQALNICVGSKEFVTSRTSSNFENFCGCK